MITTFMGKPFLYWMALDEAMQVSSDGISFPKIDELIEENHKLRGELSYYKETIKAMADRSALLDKRKEG